MLSAVSWSSFLMTLAVLVSLYYSYLFAWKGKQYLKKRRERVRSETADLTAASVDPGNDLREPLQEVPVPTGLIHEIKLHLQQIRGFDFTREETLFSVKKIVREYAQERSDMGRTGFLGQLKRAFYNMSSILLTSEEEEEFWTT